MSQAVSTSKSQPWGLISLGSGVLALFLASAGCLAGLSYMALPFGVLGLIAGEMEAEKARRGEVAELSTATLGIVFSTISLAAQLVFATAFVLFIVSYLMMMFGLVLFA